MIVFVVEGTLFFRFTGTPDRLKPHILRFREEPTLPVGIGCLVFPPTFYPDRVGWAFAVRRRGLLGFRSSSLPKARLRPLFFFWGGTKIYLAPLDSKR